MRTLRGLIMASIFGSIAMANHLWYPTAVYQSKLDRIVVFVTDDSGNLYDTYWNGTQWAWESQALYPGVSAKCQGAVYESARDRVHVFAAGGDTQLYEKFWDSQYQQWDPTRWFSPSSSVGIFCPSVVYQPTLYDPIVVFATGTDAHFYELAMLPGSLAKQWYDISAPAGGLLSAPSAVYQPTKDQIVVFGGGWGSGHLNVWNSHQLNWKDLGLPPGANYVVNPSVVYQSKIDRIAVFFTSLGNGHLYDAYGDGQQWAWDTDQGTPPGVNWVANPSAVYQTSLDRIVVFVTGSDGHLYDKYFDGHQWRWDTDQGTPTGVNWVANPSAVYRTSLDRIMVFVTGSDGHLYDKYWDGRQWRWEDRGQP